MSARKTAGATAAPAKTPSTKKPRAKRKKVCPHCRRRISPKMYAYHLKQKHGQHHPAHQEAQAKRMSNLVISLVLDAVRRSDFKTAKALVKGLDENR